VAQLSELLDRHLGVEEAKIVPALREMPGFAMPVEEAHGDLFAQGFAWASHGIAPDVLERAYATVPSIVTSRIPAARAAFQARFERVWGSAPSGASRTAVPDWLAGR
jgi:hypothetical protein